MTIERRALAGVLASLLLVAACGGSASTAPSAAPSASAAPTASATPEATPTEAAPTEAAETPGSSFEASFQPGAASDLEALLPAEVNGVAFTRTSFTGESIPPGTPIGDSDLENLLKDNGKSLSDVRVAMSTAGDAASQGNLVMAIQIKGVDSAKLQAWAIKSIGDSSATPTTIGGKQVYGSGAAGFGGAYLYIKGDVVFYIVSVGTTNMAEAIISKLP